MSNFTGELFLNDDDDDDKDYDSRDAGDKTSRCDVSDFTGRLFFE